ncbi:L-idonate 5-dehydrogenase [Leucobacter allii]|uniref:L-idonate 5-dehydrogenase n=1 Tax=Leucobacter allii TaxID=2932247 RepID=A0ABY4FNN3_9MICO|nr:L-idonate 5-dehydrogenase [Leucobacter allii]UOQ57867.1 L-idonate 5-dehydrogenase [Leucobacter allii]
MEQPLLESDGVLVRVAFGGICGSDLHYYRHGRNGIYELRSPLVLGHEIVGTIAEIAPGVPGDLLVGQAVAIHPAIPTPPPGGAAGHGLHLAPGGSYLGSASTVPHTPGGFAEFVRTTADQLRRLPEGLPLRRAALAEPLAVALHGVDRYEGDYAGKRVLVSGAGPIGCLAIAALRRRGAGEIVATDMWEEPLRVARMVGADEARRLGVDPPLADDAFDVVIEASGSPAATVSALRAVRRGGTIVQLGMLPDGELPVPLASLVSREVTLRGSQRFDVELDESVRILAHSEALDAVVSHVFPVEHARKAFETAADSRGSTKVLIEF